MTGPVFTENWFDTPSIELLVRLAESVRHLHGRIVEIGCWEGRSTIALANTVYPASVDAVDHWKGCLSDTSGQLAAERDVFATFRANIAAGTKGNVTVHRADWRDYTFPPRIRFCLIDADHSYKEVHDTITAVWPLVIPGGVLCGDDIRLDGVFQAVHEHFPNGFETAATMWYVRR